MQKSHQQAIDKYEEYRNQARSIAMENLPESLKSLRLASVDNKALQAFEMWQEIPERKVDWDWTFANRYCVRYPKAFDLSVWASNTLLSLTLGRPTYNGTSIRMDFIERRPSYCPYSGQLFSVSQLAYETYGRLIGAEYIRIVEPMNNALIAYYTSQDGGFKLMPGSQSNPCYLVKHL